MTSVVPVVRLAHVWTGRATYRWAHMYRNGDRPRFATMRVVIVTLVAFGMWRVLTPTGADLAADTDIGTARVELDTNVARSVQRVEYRHEVERLGDVVVVDGEPAQEITDPVIEAIWLLVDQTWPASLDDELVQLSVVREQPRELVGVVHPANGGGWILSLDAMDLNDPELLVETIVHELSHVVTLAPEVFTFGDVDCDGAKIELGCAHEGSVLARFAETYWPDDVSNSDADGFVNSYASSAAHEDLAETFTAWVLDWDVSDEVRTTKMAMLAADPELAALATALQARL